VNAQFRQGEALNRQRSQGAKLANPVIRLGPQVLAHFLQAFKKSPTAHLLFSSFIACDPEFRWQAKQIKGLSITVNFEFQIVKRS